MTTHAGNGNADADRRFRGLILDASLADDSDENVFHALLRKHFGVDPMQLAETTMRPHSSYRMVTQAGIDAYLAGPGRKHEVVGVDSPAGDGGIRLSVAKMLSRSSLGWTGATRSQPTWERLQVGYDRRLRCLVQGLILVQDAADGPAAIWVTTTTYPQLLRSYTILGATAAQTLAIAGEIRRLSVERSPFIGEMFTQGYGVPTFLPRPRGVSREDLILPPGVLDRIDQHAVGITRAGDRLTAAGQHLKRGLLLYGPPGTGKTHTLRYLISQLPTDTTIVVGNPSMPMYAYERVYQLMGRSALILFDDVDQVGVHRDLGAGDREPLFTLLEAMDGLQGVGDVLFVLTTNRPEVLEPAIAARPGRIDEVLEIPRPDADCRRRLFARYRQGMALEITDIDIETIVERTDGVTGSFTKEMLRRATVIAVERGAKLGANQQVQVAGADVFAALDEMLDPANPATRVLLGAPPDHAVRKIAVTTGASQ